jgi:CDP-6-deoxy-D-xylo-4-hexulose-3-dehydrase
MIRRWGRRSEVQSYGSGGGERTLRENLDGVLYDSSFIFDELCWNFEPSELGAAYGLQQLKKLPQFIARRRRTFELYQEMFGQHPDVFITPRTLEGLETVWMVCLAMIRPESGVSRSELQEYLEGRGIDTRTVWSGNAARQPFFKNVTYRVPPGGLPNADRVMEWGITLPSSHGLDDEDIAWVAESVDSFLAQR